MKKLDQWLVGNLITTGIFVLIGLGWDAGRSGGQRPRQVSARRARAKHVPVRRW